MRIGLVLPVLPPCCEASFKSKINGLLRSGFSVTVIVSECNNIQYASVKVVKQYTRLRNRHIQLVFAFLVAGLIFVKRPIRIFRFVREEFACRRPFRKIIENIHINAHILGLDLDWLHFGFAASGLGRENVGRALGCRVALSLVGHDRLKQIGYYELLWKRIDRIHTISDDLVTELRNAGLLEGLQIVKIAPAIEFNDFVVKDEQKYPLRILTVCSLDWRSGLEYTLQGLALFWSHHKISFKYTVVGVGDDWERLLFASHQLGISDKVIFLGKMAQRQVLELMAENDLYIHYSVQEDFCNSVLAAQAAGMLCIVSNAEGFGKSIVDTESGFVINKREPLQLVEKLVDITKMTDRQFEAMSKSAIERVKHDFGPERQRLKFCEFYSI